MLLSVLIDPEMFLLGIFILTTVAWSTALLTSKKFAWSTGKSSSIFKLKTEGFNKFDLIGLVLFLALFSSNVWLPLILSKETLQAKAPAEMSEWLQSIVFLVAGIMQFLIPCALLLYSFSFRANLFDAFGLKKVNWKLVTRATLIGLFSSFLFLFLLEKADYESVMFKIFGEGKQAAVDSLLNASSTPKLIAIGIVAVVAAPIGEEILFRGLLQGATKKYTGAIFAIISSSLFFAVIHGHATNLLPLFMVGAILAIVYEISGSLWTSITLHALFNLINVLHMIGSKANENS